MSVAAAYTASAAHCASLRDERAGVSARISRLRLATFLPAAACLVWLLSQGFTTGLALIAVALFAAFGALVAWHARVEERLAWYEALRVVNVRGAARVSRDWASLPAGGPPAGTDLSGHPYALDLDVFGRASLYQWLGPAATVQGARVLAAWLLSPADRPEIEARQQAAAELAPAVQWRAEFAGYGVLTTAATPPRIDGFLGWAEGADPLGSHASLIRAAVIAITAAMWLLIALQIAGVTATALWMIPLLAGLILSFGLSSRLTDAFERAGGGQLALRSYAGLFEHASQAPAASPRLADIQTRLSAEGMVAARCMRRLNNILGFADLSFPDPGADAVGLPCVLRAREVAAERGPARAKLARCAGLARCADARGRRAPRQSGMVRPDHRRSAAHRGRPPRTPFNP
jgi:hypothetical protein